MPPRTASTPSGSSLDGRRSATRSPSRCTTQPELAVAATKTYVNTLAALVLLAGHSRDRAQAPGHLSRRSRAAHRDRSRARARRRARPALSRLGPSHRTTAPWRRSGRRQAARGRWARASSRAVLRPTASRAPPTECPCRPRSPPCSLLSCRSSPDSSSPGRSPVPAASTRTPPRARQGHVGPLSRAARAKASLEATTSRESRRRAGAGGSPAAQPGPGRGTPRPGIRGRGPSGRSSCTRGSPRRGT
jgi:hypothetical protein